MRSRPWLSLLLCCLVGGCATGGVPEVPVEHRTLRARCDPFQIELDPAVKPGQRLEAPMPRAPRDGSRRGVACAEVTIDTAGRVIDPEIVYTTNREFARSFLRALRHWRYEPATRDGDPTEVRIVLDATFTID